MSFKRQSGFTLVETMTTLSVAAILMGLAAPSFVETVRSNRLATSANELVAAVQIARTAAIRDSRRVTLCVSSDQATCTNGTNWSAGWIIWSDRDRDSTLDAGEILRIGQPLDGNTSLDAASRSDFVFEPSGLVNAGDTFEVCSGASGTTGRQITITPVGGVVLDAQHTCI